MGGIPGVCSDPIYPLRDDGSIDPSVTLDDLADCDESAGTHDTGALPPSTDDATARARAAARSLPPVPVGGGTGVFAPRRIPSTGPIFVAETRRALSGGGHSVAAHEVTGREKFAGMANGDTVGNYTVVRVGERVFLAQTDQPNLAAVVSSGAISVRDDSVG